MNKSRTEQKIMTERKRLRLRVSFRHKLDIDTM